MVKCTKTLKLPSKDAKRQELQSAGQAGGQTRWVNLLPLPGEGSPHTQDSKDLFLKRWQTCTFPDLYVSETRCFRNLRSESLRLEVRQWFSLKDGDDQVGTYGGTLGIFSFMIWLGYMGVCSLYFMESYTLDLRLSFQIKGKWEKKIYMHVNV